MARSGRQKRERRYTSAKKRAETHKTGFDRTSIKVGSDVTFFALDRAGTRRIDVLPYVAGEGNPFADPGELHYERTFFVHRGIGANSDTFVCSAKTAKKPCPVCEHRMKLMKDPDADEDQIKDLAPKERQLWNVIDRDAPEKGVQLWDISYHLFGKLLDTEIRNADEDEDYDSFFHLESGKTLKLGIGERSFGGRSFYEVETISFKPRGTDYDDDALEKCHVLDDLPIVMEYDKLKAIFLQTADAEEDQEEEEPEEEEENSQQTRAKSAKKSEVDEDDDDWVEKGRDKKGRKSVEVLDLSAGDLVRYEEEACEVLKVGDGGTKLLLESIESGEIYKDVHVKRVSMEQEQEQEKPSKPSKSLKSSKSVVEPDEDDWDEGDEEEKKPAAKPAKRSKPKTTEKDDDEEPSGDDGDWDNWD